MIFWGKFDYFFVVRFPVFEFFQNFGHTQDMHAPLHIIYRKHSTKYKGIDHSWFLYEAGVRVSMALIFVSGTFFKNQYKYSYGFISCDLQLVNTV